MVSILVAGVIRMTQKNNSENVRSVQRALDILLCFNWYERELTLTEISEKLNLAKSTTSRILLTLVNQNFLTRDEKSGEYKLGDNLYYLGLIAKDSLDLRSIAHPIMIELMETTGETINIYLLEGKERVCFDQVESPHIIKQTVNIGERFPLWDGATGKIILANLSKNVWHEMIDELYPITDKTIVDPDEFISLLNEYKESGVAVTVGEKNFDIGCAAAPFFNNTGNVMGSISISGPSSRFPENTDQYSYLVIDAARKISNQLGYYGRSRVI